MSPTPSSAAEVATKGMLAYAAPSLFQPHRVREAIRDAHAGRIPPMLGYYAGLSSVPITRFLAPMGFDTVWIDWEHTSCNVETMTTMVHEAMFLSQGRTIPFVRVPGHDHAAIGYALDAGASLVIPQVETVEQAKHVISAAKYGVKNGNGSRSAPPFRLIPGLTDTPYDSSRDFHSCVNDQAAIMIQIESVKGVENLDAILTECPEIDIVWFGTLDCRVSMGLPANMGMGGTEPEWLAASKLFYDTIDKHDKPLGGFGFVNPPFGQGPEAWLKHTKRMSFIMMTADVGMLMGMKAELDGARMLCAGTAANGKTANGVNGETNGVNGETNGVANGVANGKEIEVAVKN